MDRRTLLGGTAAAVLAPALPGRAQVGRTEAGRAGAGRTAVVLWHAMAAALGAEVNRLAAAFNGSQAAYEVQPVFKGTYPETLTAAIAAFRAGQAPHLVQVFEVGTGTMLAAGGAVKPAWQLGAESGVAIRAGDYIPAVRGYYSLPAGRLALVPVNSSGERGDLLKGATFQWAAALLPYDPAITAAPINSIIGGASLWAMTAPHRTAAEYGGAAEFLAFLAQPENAAAWHQRTGYVPVTVAGYELSKQQGYYAANPGTELPVEQLTRGSVTANSRGLRLGRLPEIRNIIYEEVEQALQGQQTAEAAMASAASRGNRVLRDFQKSVRT